jgi:hypothetical protein
MAESSKGWSCGGGKIPPSLKLRRDKPRRQGGSRQKTKNQLTAPAAFAIFAAAMTPLQGELCFAADGPEVGYTKWVALRQLAVEAAAQKLNLPLGHRSEVWLRGGIRLRGTLRLANEILFIEETRMLELALVVDGVTFTYAEMESCLRLV